MSVTNILASLKETFKGLVRTGSQTIIIVTVMRINIALIEDSWVEFNIGDQFLKLRKGETHHLDFKEIPNLFFKVRTASQKEIGSKEIDLYKKLIYYDAYSIQNNRFFRFALLEKFEKCQVSIDINIVLSDRDKENLIGQKINVFEELDMTNYLTCCSKKIKNPFKRKFTWKKLAPSNSTPVIHPYHIKK